MYQQDDLLPSNRNYMFLLGCFTLIFSIVIVFVLISRNKPEIPKNNNNIIRKNEDTFPSADLTKYNQDSDNDLIPNFIEDEAILNTYVSEKDYCEGSNPTCKENPFSTPTYITVLIDSSTSMDIPAKENLTKIELIKKDLNSFLGDSFNQTFVQTQFIGFGNKGNISFIAANESCVSSVNFKGYQQSLKNKESIQLVFNNLVPNGKSPISYTLQQVEKSFPDKKGNNLVIILTDGIDDCGSDLTASFKDVLSRGVVKKINLLSLYSSDDDNQKLREATERNGGQFSNTSEIYRTISNWEKEFILNNWCKSIIQNTVNQCLNKNYNLAFEQLDKQVTSTTPQNEINKIREIKSSVDLYLQNYRNAQGSMVSKEFEELFKKALKKD